MTDVHVIHFWSPTCPPCKAIKPTLDTIQEEFEGQLDWNSVNIKEDPKRYGAKFNISVVPTIVVFKGNTEVGRYSGTQIAIIYALIRKGLTA